MAASLLPPIPGASAARVDCDRQPELCEEPPPYDPPPPPPPTYGPYVRPTQTTDQCLLNVADEFNNIPVDPQSNDRRGFAVWGGTSIPWPIYTGDTANYAGWQNHIQGINRVKGNWLYFSGSNVNANEHGAHLFIAKLPYKSTDPGHLWTGSTGGNRADRSIDGSWLYNVPPASDAVTRIITLDKGDLWHAGGMQTSGDYLVIPLEGSANGGFSKIIFLNTADPSYPHRYSFELNRLTFKAGSAALVRPLDPKFGGRMLLGVWTHEASNWTMSGKMLNFHWSNPPATPDHVADPLLAGFSNHSVYTDPDTASMLIEDYQTMNFVQQCDGKLFMVAMHKAGPATLPGDDLMDLFSLEFSSADDVRPRIAKIGSRHFYCWNAQCSFDAGTGIHIKTHTDPSQRRMMLYGMDYFRQNASRGQNFIYPFLEFGRSSDDGTM